VYINKSNVIQTVYGQDGEPYAIFPNEAVSEDALTLVTRLPSFKKINKVILDYNSIFLRRTHALGDIVLLFPIVNYLRKRGKQVYLCTNDRYAIKNIDFIIPSPTYFSRDFDISYNLTGVLELDHIKANLFERSRLDIYCDFLKILDLGTPDWNINIEDVNFPKDVLGIQLSGSTAFKNVDLSTTIARLSKKYKLFIIDAFGNFVKNDNTLYEKVSLSKLLSYMKKMIGVVCFDSGPLWLSHVTNTPAFVIVGPTSGKKVIKHHPNSKTCYFDTKQDVGCVTSCGESLKACKGKCKCMKNVNQSRLNSELASWIKELI